MPLRIVDGATEGNIAGNANVGGNGNILLRRRMYSNIQIRMSKFDLSVVNKSYDGCLH